MAGGEDQNPASSSPGLTGEVVGSDEGLTTISFWGLDGGEMGSQGVGGAPPLGRPPVPPLLGVGVLWSPGDRAGAWRRTARARGGRCRERWTSGGVSSAGSSGWPRRRRTGTAGPTCWRTEQSREVRRARGSISSPPRPVVGAPARGADVDDGRGACRSAWQRPAGLSPWARRTVRPRGGGSIATPGPQRRCRGLRTPG
jgi:hypothetical protein